MTYLDTKSAQAPDLVQHEIDIIRALTLQGEAVRNFTKKMGPVKDQTGHEKIHRKIILRATQDAATAYMNLLTSVMLAEWGRDAYSVKPTACGNHLLVFVEGTKEKRASIEIKEHILLHTLGYIKGAVSLAGSSLKTISKKSTKEGKIWAQTGLRAGDVGLVGLMLEKTYFYGNRTCHTIAARSPQEATAILACSFDRAFFRPYLEYSVSESKEAYQEGYQTGLASFERVAYSTMIPHLFSVLRHHPLVMCDWKKPKTHSTSSQAHSSLSSVFNKKLVIEDTYYTLILQKNTLYATHDDIFSASCKIKKILDQNNWDQSCLKTYKVAINKAMFERKNFSLVKAYNEEHARILLELQHIIAGMTILTSSHIVVSLHKS